MYRIAIPTYNRYDNFKTIDFLKKNNVSIDMIDIFVANDEQLQLYKNSIGENYNFIIGVIGLVEQRNFISDYYDEGQIIISMDDDIEDLIEKDNKPFLEWINDCINFMNENSVGIIGINPSVNPFFFEQRIKTTSSFKIGRYLVIGCFQILRNHKDLKLNYISMEDWERSILYFLKYGNTGRYNNVLIKTKYFLKKGGLSTQRNKDNYNNSLNCLLYNYHNLLKYNYKKLPLDKYNEMPNLVFKKHCEFIDVIKLPSIPASEFCILYSMLEDIYLTRRLKATNRRGFPIGHQSATFGYTRARFGRKYGELFDLSNYSIKYPEIYNELLRIGNIYCPFKFTSIHVNKNVVCPKHIDNKNVGKSMLVSFGDYTGCKIIIDNIEYDADCNPVIFDGSKIEHWNTDDLEGTKYSLVFFNSQ